MYSQGKYVSGEIGGLACAVCFTEVIEHAVVGRMFDKDQIWGAGFFYLIEDDEMPSFLSASLNGKSVSLGKEVGPHDLKLVNRALGLDPI